MAPSPPLTSPTAQPARRSASPPPQPVNKREKRRNIMSDKLEQLTTSFNQNRDPQFRDQIKALQSDMTLIVEAEPYKTEPLGDSGEEIAQLVEQNNLPNTYSSGNTRLAGKWYSEYALAVNESKESRDTDLTLLMHRHESSLARLRRDRDFKIRLAVEECTALSSTLRERLVQTIGQKKARLVKEKEHLDIADTNALLLHPAQFSITNPASPGGAQSNRKTRHTRHQRVELDDLGNSLAVEGINKRKRKLPIEDDLGSPNRDGTSTPYERAKARNIAHQTAPVYTIDRLFTDKELAMHSNTAHAATIHFFATSKQAQKNGNGSAALTNGNNTDGEEQSGETTGQEDDANLEAPEMDRTASQTFHATRSTRNAGAVGLNLLGDLADKAATRPPIPYVLLQNYQPPSMVKAGQSAPPVPGLMQEEVTADLVTLGKYAQKPKGWVDKELVDELTAPMEEQPSWSTLHPDFPASLNVHMIDVNMRNPLGEISEVASHMA